MASAYFSVGYHSSLADFAATKTFVEEAKGFQNHIGFGGRRCSPQAVRCLKV